MGKEVNPPMLEVRNLEKEFTRSDGTSVKAVDDVTFSVQHGEVVGLLGPNGAGKTTIVKSILGLVRPTAGDIYINGIDRREEKRRAVNHASAVLEGARNIYWRMTARGNIEFFASLHGWEPSEMKPYANYLMEMFDLYRVRNEPARELSLGMKQKVAICCILVKRTPLVFLDEPTLGLDVATSHELRRRLKELASEEERTFVISSHDMDVVQDACRRVIILSEGRIIADEAVRDLLELFQSRAYRLQVQGNLLGDFREALQKEFPGAEVEMGRYETTLEVDLLEPRSIYELMDLLHEQEVILESINREEVDLEQVFLQLTQADGEDEEGTALDERATSREEVAGDIG